MGVKMQVDETRQQTTTENTQTETQVEKETQNQNNNEGSGPLDNLSQEELKAWARRQAADASKYHKKYSAMKSQLEQKEQEALEAQGKYKEMYEQAQTKLQKLQGGIQRGMVTSQVKDALLQLGCNPQLVDKALRHADVDSIETDPETYKADVDQVMFEAKRVKEEVPVFFGSNFKKPKDGVPGSTEAPTKSIKEMSDDELDKMFKAALRNS